ncbi:ABC transporter ATP-binding protein [Frigoribacterium faeni]|uniref:Oligopeptide ABC transporter, ATP-binding protein n=1 Tax=Frigoribacterium faeni TaxID=145483 RepID=A0A7W3PIE3_9MICO|nr:ABC transporter ATP-binding protein [Frigoribacterium faeni]MBA8813345.1 peptide/nickel transport system ATP-binding protein [Frigoribacterium faeni]BFF14570.1 ABC transporter ATP-binding protein [Microbacterium flavescens]GEK84794.1 putative oligopeptide ABC transporter, ATP-binding protein [Frigoribacterium faeni]
MTDERQGDPLLSVTDLTIRFDVDGDDESAVDGVSFDVRRGEVLAVVGESGSGKSVTAMSVLGLLPANATVGGSLRFDGVELVGRGEATLRSIRGDRVAMIFQDPLAALNPVFTVGFQIEEAVRRHDPSLSRGAVRSRAVELLASVEIPEPEARLRSFPHQLSGGQCQRIMIAMALASDPDLLIADEPTTALDVTVQAEVLDVLRRLQQRSGTSILLITHDMGVVADLADRVVVMRAGRVVETDDVAPLFGSPSADYTRDLLRAVPRVGERASTEARPPVGAPLETPVPALAIRDLVVEYGNRLVGRFRAVDEVGFEVARGEILGLVGESGSGKTTIGRAAIGLAPVSSGSVYATGVDLRTAGRREIAAMRERVGVVFQNPATSLNPRYSIAQTVAEPLQVRRGLRGSELTDRVDALLSDVGLGGAWRERYPHELSGGQRQRVAIARAVALDPDLLIADEPTSALDVSVQARVLDVFRSLQDRLGFACLFISHDLAVVDSLCDRIAVLRSGRLVEIGDRSEILTSPSDDYTRRLIASAPVPDPIEQRRRREERLSA